MSGLVILGDAAVHGLLINLSKPDISSFQTTLQDALRRYSVDAERKFQPASASVVRPNGQKTLFRPFTSPSHVGTKIIVDPAPDRSSGTEQKAPLHGVLVLCDNNGIPAGLINAEEVTAFRTSLSALIAWSWRRHTESILVFGAGKQALWHIRLALATRGDEIKHITVVNRSHRRAVTLVAQLESENATRWKSLASIKALDPSASDHEVSLKSHLTDADAIFCTVPSTEPLFHKSDVEAPLGRPPYISAIGSWQPNMIELDPELLIEVASEGPYFDTDAGSTHGVILVDDRTSCSDHAGEIVKAKLEDKQLVEIGEILDMKESKKISKKQLDWLQKGYVIYKSVGVSLTDLAAGQAILRIAKQNGVGQLVKDL